MRIVRNVPVDLQSLRELWVFQWQLWASVKTFTNLSLPSLPQLLISCWNPPPCLLPASIYYLLSLHIPLRPSHILLHLLLFNLWSHWGTSFLPPTFSTSLLLPTALSTHPYLPFPLVFHVISCLRSLTVTFLFSLSHHFLSHHSHPSFILASYQFSTR